MTDRNRNQDPPTREQPQSSVDRDRASVADDRGIDHDRRSFNQDRENDELGSEMEDDLDLDQDDELGGSER